LLKTLAKDVGQTDNDLAFLRALLTQLAALIEDPETPPSVVVQLNQEAARVVGLVREIVAKEVKPESADLIARLKVVP